MVGKISTTFAKFESDRWIKEGLILSVLLFIRSVVNYWQQAFLWEAALNSACRIRAHVFDRVLKRDLGFFEGSGVVSTGDIAYRITAEAADVADTVYALLNVSMSFFVSLLIRVPFFFLHENLKIPIMILHQSILFVYLFILGFVMF